MKKTLIISMLFLMPFSSFAQDAFYVSGMLGLGTLNQTGYQSDDYNKELTYGARAGVLFTDHISVGLYLQRLKTKDGVGPNTTADNIMAEVTYYLSEASEDSFWVSGLLGVTQFATDSSSLLPSSDESVTSYGINMGYHFMLGPNFSLSPQVTYVYMDDVNQSSFSELSALLNLTAWF